MPTLVRFLTALALIAAALFAVMAGLVYLVEPHRRPVVVDVPLKQFQESAPAGQRVAPPGEGLQP